MGVGGQRNAPVVLLPLPWKDPVPIVQEAGWAPGPVWMGAENLPPPGFDPRTVQPVASRYTDWSIAVPHYYYYYYYVVTGISKEPNVFLFMCVI